MVCFFLPHGIYLITVSFFEALSQLLENKLKTGTKINSKFCFFFIFIFKLKVFDL